MDRTRTQSPIYVRQKSNSSSVGTSPMMSPIHRHARSGSSGLGNFRRQNYAAKAAAQRLAQVMASQQTDDDDDDEDDEDDDVKSVDYEPLSASSGSIGFAAGRAMKPPSPRHSRGQCPPSPRTARSPSPALGRNFGDPSPAAVRVTSSGRPSISVIPSVVGSPSKLLTKPRSSTNLAELAAENRRDKRLSADLGNMNMRETGNQRSTAAFQDELDMLQEENESLLEKLRLAEERCEEAEARARQLEKQVASLGDGVSLEARLLSRKEAALQQREAALKAAAQTNGIRKEEIAALRLEAESARDEAATAVEQLQEAEGELKSLRAMAQRMFLTEEEMEEVVLKRCWLARYWKLCVQHGACAVISG